MVYWPGVLNQFMDALSGCTPDEKEDESIVDAITLFEEPILNTTRAHVA